MSPSSPKSILLSLAVAYCPAFGQGSKPAAKPVDTAPAKIIALQNEIYELSYKIWKLENDERSAVFDPTATNGFQRIKSNNGNFLISIKSVEPYLDGVKVTIKIGNLYSASFEGYILNIQWGSRHDGKEKYSDWLKSLKSKSITFPDTIRGGTWNLATFVLAPANPTAFGYIKIELENNTVILQN